MGKKRSTVAKGNYYKRKTRDWLKADGYTCGPLEIIRRIFIPPKEKGKKGTVLFTKVDMWGADVLAMNGEQVVFAQSKLGRKNIAEGIKEFKKYPFPKSEQVKRWIFVWTPRVKEPEIIVVE